MNNSKKNKLLIVSFPTELSFGKTGSINIEKRKKFEIKSKKNCQFL